MTQSNRSLMASFNDYPVARQHQIGIRQRSLRGRCRLGRATELVFILATGLTLVLSGGAEAQSWNGNGANNNWDTIGNWSTNTVPAAGATVSIDGTGGLDQPTLNVASAALTATNVSGGTLTVSNVLTSTNVTLSNIGFMTIDAGASVVGAVVVGSSGTLTNNGTITGTLGITGGLTDNAGIVTGATTISGGTLNLAAGSDLANAAALTVSGGTVNVNANDTVGGVSLQGGAINGAAVLTSASAFDVQSGSAAAILDGSVGLNKTTAGTVTLSGANTYTGATAITAGTLSISDGAALGTTAGATTVSSGATLALSGGITTGEAITLNGTGVASGGALRNLSGTNDVTGVITLGSNASIMVDAGQLNVGDVTGSNVTLTVGGAAGDIHLTGPITTGTGGLIKEGASTVWVEGINTFSGTTTINGGNLDVQNGSALSDTGLVQVNAGSLLVRTNETVGNIAGAGNILIGTGATLTTGDTSSTTFSGQISNAGALTKAGSGTLTLSGSNAYAGATTVNDGVLEVTGSIGSLVVDVNAGGSLQADGSALADLAAVTLNGTGNLTLTGAEVIGSLASGSGTSTVTLNGNTLTTGGNDTSTTFAGVIDSAGGLTKTGTGTMTLTGANTFTGATAVNGGALAVTGSGALASIAVQVSAGTLTTDSDALASGAVVTVSGTGTFNSSDDDSYAGITQTGGTIGGSGVQTLSGAFTQSGGTTAGTVHINAATFTQSGGATVAAGTTVTSTGVQGLQGGSVAGALDGAGTITVSTGTTTVTGAISNAASLIVSSGTLALSSAGTVDTSTNSILVNGGTLTNDGNGIADSEAVTVSSGTMTTSGADTIGSLIQSGGTVGGAGVLTAATYTQSGGSDLTGSVSTTTSATLNGGTISGTLSGAVATVQTGTTTVTGTISGNVIVDGAGRLRIANSAAIGGTITTTGSVVSYANGVDEASALILNSGTTQLEVLAAEAATQSGVISEDVSRPLEKIGAGTLTFSGANTFTGDMTVSAGTLVLSGGSALADSVDLILANGATVTVQTTETIASLASVAGGTLALGSNTLNLNGAVSTSFAGDVTGGTSANLFSNAGNTTTMTGASTMTGTMGTTGGTFIMAAGSTTAAIAVGGTGSAGVFTTNGGALASNATLVNISTSTSNINGSETIGSINQGSGGTINLASGAILTLNGTTNAFNATGASTIQNDILGAGTLNVTGGTTTVAATGNVATATTIGASGTVVNNGIMAGVSNAGSFTNNLTAGALTNTGAGTGSNSGTLASLTHNSSGLFDNAATGIVTGASTVSAGDVTNSGEFSSTLGVTAGTFTNSVGAKVIGTTTITGTGAVTNSGSMAAVTNGVSYTATSTATTGALTNTGTASITGGTTASVINNAALATTTLAGAVVSGAVTNTTGTVTSTGVTSALSLSNSGVVDAVGTLDTAVTNNAGGTFNVTGLLAAGGKAFTNAGTLNVITADYSGIGTFANNSGGVVNLGAGRTLTATTFNNNVGGTFVIAGNATIAGAFANNGTVDMADGAANQVLTISGATSGTGIYQLDLNLSDGSHDRVNAPVGVTEVHLDFNMLGSGSLLGPIVVFSGAQAGATLTQLGLPVGGAILYSLQQSSNDVQVVSSINPAVSGVAASAAMTQSLISTVVNRPTSPFVSGLAAEETCSHGGYFRASAGIGNVTGTATSNGVASDSTIASRFSGVQGGYDAGCFDGRFFDGWDGAVGMMMGYNAGSTNQNVFSDPINPTLQTGTSGSDFKQSYLGLYAAGSKDRFSGDLQLRFDQTEFDLKETAFLGAPIGLDGLSYTTKSTTAGARFNYRFDLNEEKGINFVPTVGFNYTTVSGNMLTLDDNATALDLSDDETLTINGYNTVVGFLGGTLAKTRIDAEGASATTTFVSGNYYQDFGGDRTASYSNSTLPTAQQIDIGSIGGFAEASVGINYVKILDKGPGGAKQLNANVRADARFGPNVSNSYSLTAQVRLSF